MLAWTDRVPEVLSNKGFRGLVECLETPASGPDSGLTPL